MYMSEPQRVVPQTWRAVEEIDVVFRVIISEQASIYSSTNLIRCLLQRLVVKDQLGLSWPDSARSGWPCCDAAEAMLPAQRGSPARWISNSLSSIGILPLRRNSCCRICNRVHAHTSGSSISCIILPSSCIAPGAHALHRQGSTAA